MKDTGYISNKDTIGLGVTVHVTYLSGHNDTHAVFMLVTKLTSRYSNWAVITPVTHLTGGYMIYWIIYQDLLYPLLNDNRMSRVDKN